MYESYEIFKNVLTQAFNESDSPREEDYYYEVVSVNKLNTTRDGITRKYNTTNTTAVLYIDELYKTAKDEKMSPKDLMIYIDDWFDNVERNTPPEIKAFNADNVDPAKIFPVVINTERNAELLNNVPHRDIADLSVVYYYNITSEASFLIKNDALNVMFKEYDENKLHLFAVQNASADAILASLESMMMLFENPHNFLDDEDTTIGDAPYVITNETKYRGAGILACQTILNQIYDLAGGGYYILPSSIHELLVMKDGEADVLRNLVRTVNATEVSPQDFLSDNVYYYDGEKLRIA